MKGLYGSLLRFLIHRYNDLDWWLIDILVRSILNKGYYFNGSGCGVVFGERILELTGSRDNGGGNVLFLSCDLFNIPIDGLDRIVIGDSNWW